MIIYNKITLQENIMTNIEILIGHVELYIQNLRSFLINNNTELTSAQVGAIEALDKQLFDIVKKYLDKDYLKYNHPLFGDHLKVRKLPFVKEQYKIEPKFLDYLTAFKEDLNPQDQYNSYMAASMVADKFGNG